MKRILKYSLILVMSLGALVLFGRIFDLFMVYKAHSASNYPAIELDERFIASKLKKPERFDFICYYGTIPELGRNILVHRLCGIPGDTIQIRQGILYVNGRNADPSLNLAHFYYVDPRQLNVLKSEEDHTDYSTHQISEDSFLVVIADIIAKQKLPKAVRYKLPPEKPDEYIFNQYNTQWNQDNFGPVVVPVNSLFVLGDNRHFSNDSRYMGFVSSADFVATVLWRK
jgi:signal peptidase I